MKRAKGQPKKGTLDESEGGHTPLQIPWLVTEDLPGKGYLSRCPGRQMMTKNLTVLPRAPAHRCSSDLRPWKSDIISRVREQGKSELTEFIKSMPLFGRGIVEQ